MLFPIRSRVGARRRGSTLFPGAVVVIVMAGVTGGCKRAPLPSGPFHLADVKLKPASGELATLLPAEIAKARAQHLVPYVEVGAAWCKPCRQLQASMTDPRMKDAFDGTYLIHLDVDDWSSSLSALDLEPTVIPVVFEVDAQGKSTGRSINGNDWGDNRAESMAPQLKAFFARK